MLLHKHIHSHAHTLMCADTLLHTHSHMHTRSYTHTHTHTCAPMLLHTCTHSYTFTHSHTHSHTQTHTFWLIHTHNQVAHPTISDTTPDTHTASPVSHLHARKHARTPSVKNGWAAQPLTPLPPGWAAGDLKRSAVSLGHQDMWPTAQSSNRWPRNSPSASGTAESEPRAGRPGSFPAGRLQSAGPSAAGAPARAWLGGRQGPPHPAAPVKAVLLRLLSTGSYGNGFSRKNSNVAHHTTKEVKKH